MDKYILKDGTPVKCDDANEWVRWFQNSQERQIAKTELCKHVTVSTMFLGLDHAFDGGHPILFETMIFGGKHNGDMRRYHSVEGARRGHEDMVAKAKTNPNAIPF